MTYRQLKVSVALCTYNGAAYIAPQLESILGQSRPPDEVIICDDGSSDDTPSILHDLASRYLTVHLIQNAKRQGVTRNFQKAIEHTTGDVVFLSDQDDVWFPDKIAKIVAPFSASDNVGLVYSDAVVTDGALQPTGHTLFGLQQHLQLNAARSARELIRGVGIYGCLMAFRSTLKDLVLPIPDAQGWGHDFWIAFIAHTVSEVAIIDQPLMYHRRHGSNSSPLQLGWARDWNAGMGSSTTEAYTKDRRRWEAMLERLNAIARADGLEPNDPDRIAEFIQECEHRVDLARVREHLKHTRRRGRVVPSLRFLLAGEYHRYCRGIKTFGKDLLMK